MNDGSAALLHSSADIATANASRYLQQLCKHFGHKLPVEFTPESGRIVFAAGVCELSAENDTLAISVGAQDAEDLVRLQGVVASHLERFAFRESLTIGWSGARAA